LDDKNSNIIIKFNAFTEVAYKYSDQIRRT